MACKKISVTFNPEISLHLNKLAEFTKLSVEELAERLVKEAIKSEEEDIALSKIANERDVEGARTIRDKDVDWKTVLSA